MHLRVILGASPSNPLHLQVILCVQLLHECEQFGTRHDLKYNAKKSAVMIYTDR